MKEILDATPVALHDREENWIPDPRCNRRKLHGSEIRRSVENVSG